jgi:hypothetical protein
VRDAATAALTRLTERAKALLEPRKSDVDGKRPEGRTTISKKKRKTQPGHKSGTGKAPSTKTKDPKPADASNTGESHGDDDKNATRKKQTTDAGEPKRNPSTGGRQSRAGGG